MKRPKKVLSLILAVLMVFGMMPVGVANAAEGSTTVNPEHVKINMSLGKMGKMNVVVGLDEEYNDIKEERQLVNNDMYQNNLEAQDGYTVTSPNVTQRLSNFTKAESYFEPISEESIIQPGDVVWLAINADMSALINGSKGIKGLFNAGIIIEYDNTKLTALEGQVSDVEAGDVQSYGTIVNGSASGKIAPVAVAKNIPLLHYKAGNFGVTTSTKNTTVKGQEAAGTRSFVYTTLKSNDNTNSSMAYLPTDATWLYAVPFQVKTGTAGEFKFSFVKDELTDGSIVSSINCTKEVYGSPAPGTDNELNRVTEIDAEVLLGESKVVSGGPAGEAADYLGKLNNRKNLPYVSAAVANAEYGANDVLEFPEEEIISAPDPITGKTVGFRSGDIVIAYEKAMVDGKSTFVELGRTTITSENLWNELSKTWGLTVGAGVDIASTKMRLVREKKVVTGTGDNEQVTYEPIDGQGYITDQSEIWLGRLEAGEGKVVDTDKLIHVAITPETGLNYSGDVEAIASGNKGTKENPIEVTIGDKVMDVMKPMTTGDFATKVQAPVEGGKTVETTIDWKNWKAEDGRVIGTGTSDQTFAVHGLTKIFVPFANTQGYTQPTNYAYWNEKAAPKAEYADGTPVPQYGSAIYVKVKPNPADYFVVNVEDDAGTSDKNEENKSVTFIGATKNSLRPGDEIEFFTDNAGASSIEAITAIASVAEGAAANDITGKYSFSDANKGKLPAQGEKVYVRVTQNSVKPASVTEGFFEVPVTDGAAIVHDNVIIKGNSTEKIMISQSAKIEDIFKEINPYFYVDGIGKVPVDLENVTYDGAGSQMKYEVFNSAYVDSSYTDFNATKTKDSVYRVSYKIPDGTVDTTPYTNPGNFTVSFEAKVIEQIVIGTGTEDPLGVTVTANNPLGSWDATDNDPAHKDNWDLLTITGDKYGDQSFGVKLGDTVYLYEKGKSEPVSQGFVIKSTSASSIYTYEIKIGQLGRAPDYKNLYMTIGRPSAGNMVASEPIDFTEAIPKEKYSLVNVKAYNPGTFTVANVLTGDPAEYPYQTVSDILANTKNELPTKLQAEYAYYKYDATVADENKYVIDETTRKSTSIDLSSTEKWTTASPDASALPGEGGFVGPVEISVNWDPKGHKITEGSEDIDLVPIAGIYNTTGDTTKKTIQAQLDVASKTYDDPDNPSSPELQKDLLDGPDSGVKNLAYPNDDKIVLNNPLHGTTDTRTLTVYVYPTAEAASAHVGSVASLTLTKDAVELPEVTLDKDAQILNSAGGSLFMTIESTGATADDKAAPSAPVEVKYGIEPYTIWTTDISPEILADIKINLAQINGAGDQPVDKFNYVTDRMPKSVLVNAYHVMKDAEGNYVPKVISGNRIETVQRVTIWGIDWYNGSAIFAEGDIQLAEGNAVEQDLNLSTTLDANSLKGHSVVLTGTDGKITDTVPLYYGLDSVIGYSRTADFNKANANVSLSALNEAKMVVPTPITDYVTVSTANTPEQGDDTVEIDFSGVLDNPMADMDVVITIPTTPEEKEAGLGNTKDITGKLDSTGKVTIDKDNNSGFTGFPANGCDVNVQFTDPKKPTDNKSEIFTFKVPPQSGAYDISKIDPPMSLNLVSNSISGVTDITSLLTGLDKVTAYDEQNNKLEGVSLKKEPGSGGASDYVQWTLWATKKKDAQGKLDWTDSEIGNQPADWKAAFAEYDAAKSYRVTAQTLATDTQKDVLADSKEVINTKSILAEIKISVYNEADPNSFPLRLSQGNSDLYTEGGTAGTPAKDEIDALQAEAGEGKTVKPEDFRTDLVFYYRWETYANDVKPYVEPKVESSEGTETTTYDEMIDSVDGTKIDEWLKADAKRQVVDIKEEVVNETELSKGLKTGQKYNDHIEPSHSTNREDYFVLGQKDGVKRYTEKYKVTYVVKDENGAYYVGSRKVKLRYKPGDTKLSGNYSVSNATDIMSYLNGQYQPFLDVSGNNINTLVLQMFDINQSRNMSVSDYSEMMAILNGASTWKNSRF